MTKQFPASCRHSKLSHQACLPISRHTSRRNCRENGPLLFFPCLLVAVACLDPWKQWIHSGCPTVWRTEYAMAGRVASPHCPARLFFDGMQSIHAESGNLRIFYNSINTHEFRSMNLGCTSLAAFEGDVCSVLSRSWPRTSPASRRRTTARHPRSWKAASPLHAGYGSWVL